MRKVALPEDPESSSAQDARSRSGKYSRPVSHNACQRYFWPLVGRTAGGGVTGPLAMILSGVPSAMKS
jgi:hypothetical protein